MPDMSITDAVYIYIQTLEKHGGGQKDMKVVFIDLEKAFDRVPREEIRRCATVRNVQETYLTLIQAMYWGS